VAGHCVVPEKDSPGLEGWPWDGCWTVAADGVETGVVAQLAQLAEDVRADPAGVIARQASDEFLELPGARAVVPEFDHVCSSMSGVSPSLGDSAPVGHRRAPIGRFFPIHPDFTPGSPRFLNLRG